MAPEARVEPLPPTRRRSSRAKRATAAWVGFLLLLLAIGTLPAGRWLDHHVFEGRMRDTWGRLRWHEDWASAAPVPAGLDNRWMTVLPVPWRIAHALGASGRPAENTYVALEAAARDGFRLFEVDVWLDDHGALRCHHGPGPPPALAPGDCVLDRLLPRVATLEGWLILDIKTDFEKTGDSVIRLLKSDGLARHAVFQLYLPAHTSLFAAWAQTVPLPSPIVTAYGAHRGVQHIADNLSRLRIRAFALPFAQRAELQRKPRDVALLLHPVHDCSTFRDASSWGAAGLFALTMRPCE